MKTLLFAWLGFIALNLSINADTHIRIQCHYDSYYNYGISVPEIDVINEYWIGESKIAFLTDKGKIIFDINKKALAMVNAMTQAFIELSLPINFTEETAQDVRLLFEEDETGGSVQETGEKKKIGRWSCTGYLLKFWTAARDIRFEDMIEKIWTTDSVAFDLNLYHYFHSILYDLYHNLAHWENDFIHGLKEIKGIPVLRESQFFIKGNPRNARMEIIEMKEKTPPENIYSIPSGYRKQQKLSRDFFNPFPFHSVWGILWISE